MHLLIYLRPSSKSSYKSMYCKFQAKKARFNCCCVRLTSRRPGRCREHFMGQEVFNACYAHAWDPTCTKLLCVGGPLAYGLRGSYMALWE